MTVLATLVTALVADGPHLTQPIIVAAAVFAAFFRLRHDWAVVAVAALPAR